MKRFLSLLALVAACSSAPQTVVPTPFVPAPVAPAPKVDTVRQVDTLVVAVPRDTVTQRAKVLIPAENGYVFAADQRFISIRNPGDACQGTCGVIVGQDVVVNAIVNPGYTGPDAFGTRKLTNVGPAGDYVDNMSGQIVAQNVVDEWFFAWNKIASANPSFTPKQIQDAIAARAY